MLYYDDYLEIRVPHEFMFLIRMCTNGRIQWENQGGSRVPERLRRCQFATDVARYTNLQIIANYLRLRSVTEIGGDAS